jgi:AraC family transcriptional regulator
MYPKIQTLLSKTLLGKRLKMSFSNDRTGELWRSFMPYRKDILHKIGIDLYSMQIFGAMPDFKTDATFEKWAAVEVSAIESIPEGMGTYTLKGGLYAVFLHQGPASAFQKTFGFIFEEWLPNSEYELDDREHFELLGEKYKNNDPDSEEEVWIPIRPKG